VLLVDSHRATSKALSELLGHFGVEVELHHVGSTCSNIDGRDQCSRLEFLNRTTAIGMCDPSYNARLEAGLKGPLWLRRRFFERYREVIPARFDAVACALPASVCEIFMPFGIPILVWAVFSIDVGRENPFMWEHWLHNLRAIASKPQNVVAAECFHAQYSIRHFATLPYPLLLPTPANDAAPYRWGGPSSKALLVRVHRSSNVRLHDSAASLIVSILIKASALREGPTVLVRQVHLRL
jgi:hypothetical protein